MHSIAFYMAEKGTLALTIPIAMSVSGGGVAVRAGCIKSLQEFTAATDRNQHELQPAAPSAARLSDGGTAGQVVPAVSLGLCHRTGAIDQVTVFPSAVFFCSIHGFLSSLYCTGLFKH